MKRIAGVNSIYVNDRINTNELEEIIVKLSKSEVAHKYEDTHVQDAPFFNAIVYNSQDKASTYYVYGNNHPDLLKVIRRYSDTSLK